MALISIVPGLGVLLMSPMLFDAPGSERNVLVWMLLFTILAHPVAVINGAMIIFSNKVRNMQRYIVGVGITLAPLAFVFILFLSMDIFCDGSFRC